MGLQTDLELEELKQLAVSPRAIIITITQYHWVIINTITWYYTANTTTVLC